MHEVAGMGEWVRLASEAIVAVAMTYLALAFRAFRAEMRLEIKQAVDKLAEEISRQYVTHDTCVLRHQLIDVKMRADQ